jgi:hypothetical protein
MKFYALLQLALAILFLGLSVTVIIVVEDNKAKVLRKKVCLRTVAHVKAKPKKGHTNRYRF